MNKFKLNQLLLTKDGRKIGNAIIVQENPLHIKTDYGNLMTNLSKDELEMYFYFPDMKDFYSIDGHKHFVKK